MHARPSADSVLRKMPPPDNRRPHDLRRRNRKKTLYLHEKSANSDAKTPATHKHFSATPQLHSRERKNPPKSPTAPPDKYQKQIANSEQNPQIPAKNRRTRNPHRFLLFRPRLPQLFGDLSVHICPFRRCGRPSLVCGGQSRPLSV